MYNIRQFEYSLSLLGGINVPIPDFRVLPAYLPLKTFWVMKKKRK